MTQIFGEENDANGTPYVLLESDMKKKLHFSVNEHDFRAPSISRKKA